MKGSKGRKAGVVIERKGAAARDLVLDLNRPGPKEEARERRTDYKDLFDSAPVAYLETDRQGHITEANALACTLLGSSHDRLLGTPLSAYIAPSDRTVFREQLESARSGRNVAGARLEAQARAGSPFPASNDIAPKLDGRGTVVRLRWLIRPDATADLEKMNEMKDLLIRTLSHDLRGPLTSVLGFAVTLGRLPELNTALAYDMVGRIARNAKRMERIVEDLLDIDRLDRRVLQPMRAHTELSHLVKDVVAPIELGSHSMSVRAYGSAMIDAAKAARILENLIDDCLKHTPPDVPIWIAVTPMHGGGAIIVVEDAGPGFPDELKKTAFDPFVQGENTKPDGLGLGLTIVARFAQLHGGGAWVEDRPGGGASFHVALPGP